MNVTSRPIDLLNWTITDNRTRRLLPSLRIPSGGFAVVAATERFGENSPQFDGIVVFMPGGRLGNGLGNEGDRLILQDGRGRTIDAVSYGEDNSVFDPPLPTVVPGHSLERLPAGNNRRQAAGFVDNPRPSPGRGLYPSPSPTPTLTPKIPRPAALSSSTSDGAMSTDSTPVAASSLSPSTPTVETALVRVGEARDEPAGVDLWSFAFLGLAAVLGFILHGRRV